jgi:hypothetical protein
MIDGRAEPPVALKLVHGTEQATFSISTLAAGTHTIDATYNGDAAFATSTATRPSTEIVIPPNGPGSVPAADPPTVVSLKRYGVHMEPTVLVLTFSSALDPARAEDIHNYRIIGPNGRPVWVKSAVYDRVAHAVTLRLRSRIDIHHTSHITVIGTGARGVAGAVDVLLDGLADGKAGSDFSAPLTWRDLILTPAQARRLRLEELAARSRS